MIEQRISLVFNVLCKELFLEPYSIKHADKITKKWDKLPWFLLFFPLLYPPLILGFIPWFPVPHGINFICLVIFPSVIQTPQHKWDNHYQGPNVLIDKFLQFPHLLSSLSFISPSPCRSSYCEHIEIIRAKRFKMLVTIKTTVWKCFLPLK